MHQPARIRLGGDRGICPLDPPCCPVGNSSPYIRLVRFLPIGAAYSPASTSARTAGSTPYSYASDASTRPSIGYGARCPRSATFPSSGGSKTSATTEAQSAYWKVHPLISMLLLCFAKYSPYYFRKGARGIFYT